MHLKKGDIVQIVKGKDRPQTKEDKQKPSGKILKVMREDNRVIIEGRNLVWKHLKKTQQNPQGGRVQREAPVPAANVMLWNEEKKRVERPHFKREGGKKIRFFKSTGKQI
jgi:large subunit ribosomal protein L24